MLDSLFNRGVTSNGPRYVAPEVSYLFDTMVNVIFVGSPNAGDRGWVLVDAGMPGSAAKIRHAAASLFGEADTRQLSSVAFSPDATRVAGIDVKGNLYVWNRESGERFGDFLVRTGVVVDKSLPLELVA